MCFSAPVSFITGGDFGAAVPVSCLILLVVYTVAFTSVWCFFAAVLSLIVWLDIRSMTRTQIAKPSSV